MTEKSRSVRLPTGGSDSSASKVSADGDFTGCATREVGKKVSQQVGLGGARGRDDSTKSWTYQTSGTERSSGTWRARSVGM